MSEYFNSFDETALIYAHFGDGPIIFKTINYVVSMYCVWAERPSKAACFRVWQLQIVSGEMSFSLQFSRNINLYIWITCFIYCCLNIWTLTISSNYPFVAKSWAKISRMTRVPLPVHVGLTMNKSGFFLQEGVIQNPYIEEEQTTQWPKGKVQKDK